jgi:NAD(P)-dependent dehydrogenase (short-subunit alcohol dehydrogenase family)
MRLPTAAITKSMSSLVIIAGASGGIGRSFFQHYLTQGNQVIGIGRKAAANSRNVQLDLTDEEAAYKFVEQLDLSGVQNVRYFHSVGIDIYEPKGRPEIDEDADGIDDRVYQSNVGTFINITEPLYKKTKAGGVELQLVGIGSITDIFQVPLWRSFSLSKDKLRKLFKTSPPHVKGAMLNVSSVDTDLELYGRPFADTTYWLKPEQLVERAAPYLESQRIKYLELDIFNTDPNFNENQWEDLDSIEKRWKHDMGYTGKEVPAGRRI